MVLTLFASGGAVAGECVIVGRVAAVSPRRPVAAIDVGANSGVQSNDRAVILRDEKIVATGTVVHTEAGRCGISFAHFEDRSPQVDDRVIVVQTECSPETSESCELTFYKSAAVDREMPVGDRLWISGGSREGWRTGESVLVRRRNAVLGWGTISRCYEKSALVLLDRSREDGILPIRGDIVESIGRVGRTGQVRSRVAAMIAGGRSPQMIIAGDAQVGFAVDDRVEIIRDGEYVSHGKVISVEPFIRVEASEAFQKSSPREGDAVVLRDDPDRSGLAVGRIFRIEEDYALVTLGQVDQIEKGQRLFLLNADGSTTSLKVRTTYDEHCGAQLDSPSNHIREWQPVATFAGAAARRVVPCAMPLAEARSALPDGLAMFNPEGYCLPKVGEIIGRSRKGFAWMVIAIGPDGILAAEIASDES